MNESKNQTGDKLAAGAKRLFDGSVERLDGEALSRLNRGRNEALAELGKSRPMRQWVRWAPATGVAAAAVVVVVMMQGQPVIDPLPATDSTASDFEILLSEDSFEMLEELEFYSWIDPADLETNGNVG